MHAGFLVELGDLSLRVLVALNDVPRHQVPLEVLKGHAALLTLLHLRHIQLQLLHTVQLQIVLQYLFTPDYSVFVLTLKFALDDTGAGHRDHLHLLGLGVLYLENLGDGG